MAESPNRPFPGSSQNVPVRRAPAASARSRCELHLPPATSALDVAGEWALTAWAQA